jgi:thiamine biosynthesis lipoprotein ApbE
VAQAGGCSYRDIPLDAVAQRACLTKSMQLDLGAVAKGLAVDLAVLALAAFGGFMVDAGGDVQVTGTRPDGAAWKVGIKHPAAPDTLIDTREVVEGAVCTSGRHERADHLVDARQRAHAGRDSGDRSSRKGNQLSSVVPGIAPQEHPRSNSPLRE